MATTSSTAKPTPEMATTSSTAKPATVVDIEAPPTIVVTTAAAPPAACKPCKPCKTAALFFGALAVFAGAFAAGFFVRGRVPPPATHKLTVDGDKWRGAGVLDIEETARVLIHDRQPGTKSAIVHVAAEEVDASQSVRASFVGRKRHLAPATAADLDDKATAEDGKDQDPDEHWMFDEVEVKLEGEVVKEADVPEGARKQYLSEDGTGTFAFKLVDEEGHELEKLECDDSMRCHKKKREEHDAEHHDAEHPAEHGDEHETYTCWAAEDEHAKRGERGERAERGEHGKERERHEGHQKHDCAIVAVTIPTDEPRTCLKEIRVPCHKGSMGAEEGYCVKHVEVRC